MSKAPRKKKRHVCKVCVREHIDEAPTYPVQMYTYRNTDGNVYIDAYSVFKMLKSLGLNKQALAFMESVHDLRKKKE